MGPPEPAGVISHEIGCAAAGGAVSYETAIDVLNLRASPRPGHTEYCSNDELRRRVEAETGRGFLDAWEFDLIWSTDDGPVSWGERGRVTDMGHAEFLAGGTDRRDAVPSPFTEVSQVLEFDAACEYGLPDFDGLVAYYDKLYRARQREHPGQVYPGGYYKTIVSGAIESFGWDMLLSAAADSDGFDRVLDSFFRLSLHHYRAWAETSIEAFICHDDMVWSEGPFMHPEFYRRAVFPRYAELWKPLKDAGKRVLYCSDGDYTLFLEDIAAAGADGFIFEPLTSFERAVELYGGTHVIVGSKVDCRTLTFGTPERIRDELDATLDLASGCPGFVCAVGNHIPSNVPVENALFYFDYLKEHWRR